MKSQEKKKNKKNKGKIFEPRMYLYDSIKYTLGILTFLDLRTKNIFIKGKMPKGFKKGSYIISSNHNSFIDVPILISSFLSRRVGFVINEYILRKRISKWFFNGVGAIPIDKDNPSLESFRKVKETIERGHLVGMFPEGHLSEETFGSLKLGVVMMAYLSNVDILPVYIVKRTNRWKRQVVIYGEKVNYKDYCEGDRPTKEEMQNIAKVLKEKELELEEYSKKI